MRRWLFLPAVGFVLLLLLVCWYQVQKMRQSETQQNFITAAKTGKDPEAVVKAFLWALKVGDFRLAHELMDKASQKRITPSQLSNLLRTPLGNLIRVRQIRHIKITRSTKDLAFADFVVTFEGFPKTDVVILNQHSMPIPSLLQKFYFMHQLWNSFISNLPPTFDSAPKGGFLELKLWGSGLSITWFANTSYSTKVSPSFVFRRYKLVREEGKWRIANAVE